MLRPIDGTATLSWAAQLAQAHLHESPEAKTGRRRPYTVQDHADLIELTRQKPAPPPEEPPQDPLEDPV